MLTHRHQNTTVSGVCTHKSGRCEIFRFRWGIMRSAANVWRPLYLAREHQFAYGEKFAVDIGTVFAPLRNRDGAVFADQWDMTTHLITLKDAPEVKRIILAAFPDYRKQKATLSEFSPGIRVNSAEVDPEVVEREDDTMNYDDWKDLGCHAAYCEGLEPPDDGAQSIADAKARRSLPMIRNCCIRCGCSIQGWRRRYCSALCRQLSRQGR